jgi:hypothetical protein
LQGSIRSARDVAPFFEAPKNCFFDKHLGTRIFIGAAKKQPDGTLQTPRITYGKDGLVPPM